MIITFDGISALSLSRNQRHNIVGYGLVENRSFKKLHGHVVTRMCHGWFKFFMFFQKLAIEFKKNLSKDQLDILILRKAAYQDQDSIFPFK